MWRNLTRFLADVIKESYSEKIKLSEKKDATALASGDIAVEDVVEKLNVIRSGKSFKDEEVLVNMQKYLEELEKPEKTALLAFLKGISEIVTAGVSGAKAFEPTDSPSKVKMDKKSSEKKKISVTPNVIKKPESEETKKSSKPSEDTSPPAPIEPKKK
jgi:hypothetical protein